MKSNFSFITVVLAAFAFAAFIAFITVVLAAFAIAAFIAFMAAGRVGDFAFAVFIAFITDVLFNRSPSTDSQY